MDYIKLKEEQKVLDQYILDKHNLDESDTIVDRILSFQVELGELANETRCFKYWSIKPASEKSVILEEFVDGLHFLLSLSNTFGFTLQSEKEENEFTTSLTDQFIDLYGLSSLMRLELDKDLFSEVFSRYMNIAYTLGFSDDEIIESYMDKNALNHRRQDSGY
jgi:dimeric dUTPase (all-alpha-NTP-PPase superfamily)